MQALSFLLLVTACVSEYVKTPFYGLPRLRQCVVEVDSDSQVHKHGKNLRIIREVNGQVISSRDVVVPDECHTDGFVEKLKAKKRSSVKPNKILPGQAPGLDGWLDYASAFPLGYTGNISRFSGRYTIPGNPAQDVGQTLYYFIGLENIISSDVGSLNILQPVLAWYSGAWSLSSWDCCPNNITLHSKTLFGLAPGDQIEGTIRRHSPYSWIINSVVLKSGANTTLVSHVGAYDYNWAAAALEVYGVNACNQFPPGPMKFTHLSLLGPTGHTVSPSWQMTPPTSCGGVINASKIGISITHSQTGVF